MKLLQKIYQRSSINLLIFAVGIFILIALNYTEAVTTFQLKDTYLLGFNAFIFLGLTKVIDLGTGVNSQIIATSNYWRFELISGVVLLFVMIPSTYFLTKEYDLTGPAIANLISISVYNIIRIIFLWKKFKLFPFTLNSLYTLLIGTVGFMICYFGLNTIHGIGGMFLRSILFIILYGGAKLLLKLSPDIQRVMQTIMKRLRLKPPSDLPR